MKQVYIFDLEVYPNLFYAVFKKLGDDEIKTFNHSQLNELRDFLKTDLLLIGFNNRHYDSPILHAILEGVSTTREIYNISLLIIGGGLHNTEYKKYMWQHPWSEVDLKAIGLYGRDWSLKKHEIRMRMAKVEDLPYPFDTDLTDDQITHVEKYCRDGDIVATELLYEDFNQSGVLDTSRKLAELYPFTGEQAFYSNNPKMGELILNELYKREVGLDSIKMINKPNESIFDANDLDDKIFFEKQVNIDALEYIKSIPPENVVDIAEDGYRSLGVAKWRISHLNDIRFKTGDIEFTIGVGGLHSSFNQCRVEGNLIDFDVSTYYPSIIRNNNKPPMGLSKAWLTVFSNLYDERLKAKEQGDKAASNIFKLIINSAYGKSNSYGSIFYDPSLLMMTTITGQLYLIMLCEWFTNAGFKIVSANTDGITVDVEDRLEVAREIAKNWQTLLNLTLDETHYTKYVSRGVNDYFAVEKDGSIKRKGLFNTNNNLNPAVIVDAVVNYYVKNEPIEDYIKHQTDLFDFLQHGQATGTDITWRDQALQKNNRWYYSTDGTPIYFNRRGSNKKTQVTGSSNCVPANHITSAAIPEDLNYAYYIAEAQKIITGIDNELPSTHKNTTELLYQKSKLEKCNVYAVPKGTKDQYKANHWGKIPTTPDEIQSDYPWYLYNGIGILTGKHFKTIAIDIDDVELAKQTNLYKYLQKSKAHLTCWHNVGKRIDVASGNIKGTILFEYEDDDLFRTNEKFAKQNGFEILYGKNVVQALGVHGNGEPYQYGGNLKPIPPSLLTFLKNSLTGYSEPGNTHDYEPLDLSCQDDAIRRIENVTWAAEKLGVELTAFKFGDSIALQGLCPYEHQDDQDTTQFTVFLNNNGSLGQNCRHKQCSKKREEFIWQLRKIVNKIKPVEDDKEPSHGNDEDTGFIQPTTYKEPELLPNQEDIIQAINLDYTFKAILAPTGGGKTFSISNVVSRNVVEDPSFKAMIVVNTNQQIEQVMGEIQNALNIDQLSQHGIYGVCSESLQVGEEPTVKRLPEKARVIITNFTNISRRGDDIQHFKTIQFADKDTHVYIDEADSYVNGQTIRIPLGWRGMASSKVGDDVVFNYVDSCPGHGDFNACKKCKGFGLKGRTYGVNWRGMREYKPRDHVDTSIDYTDSAYIDFEPYMSKSELLTENLEVMFLQDRGKVRNVKTDDESAGSLNEYFKDVLDNGFRPTVWTDALCYKNEIISRDEAINLLDKDENNRYLLQFPQSPCGVHHVTTIDKIGINHLSGCKSITLLTATMTHNAKQFFSSMLDDLKVVEIKAKEEQKMENIRLVGTSKGIKPKNFSDVKYNAKVLRFNPTKLKSYSQFKALSNDVKSNLALNAHDINDKYQDRIVKQKTISDNVNLVLTHSLGVIGRGMNMPDFDVSIIDARIYKPTIAYQADSLKNIRDQQNEDRLVVIIQNSGRILRGGGYKTIVVDRLQSVMDLVYVGENLQNMSSTEVKVDLLLGCVKGADLTPMLQHVIDGETTLCPGTNEYYEDLCINNKGIPFRKLKLPSGLSKQEKQRYEKLYNENLINFDSDLDRVTKYKKKYKTVGRVKSKLKYNQWSAEKQQWFDDIFDDL